MTGQLLTERNATDLSTSHFFGIWKEGNLLVAALQFSVGPEHPTSPCLVLLGQTSRAVERRVHQAAYYGGKINHYDGDFKEITKMRADH